MTPEQRFESAYRAHYWAVVRYLARRAGADPAQDLAAEVFTTAWRRRTHLPGDAALPWLYATAANTVRNHRRRQSRQANVVAKLLALPSLEQGPALVEPVEDSGVHRALSALSARDQEVLRLFAWEELDTEQMAAALSTSRSGAAMRLHRARRRLREQLASQPTPTQTTRRAR